MNFFLVNYDQVTFGTVTDRQTDRRKATQKCHGEKRDLGEILQDNSIHFHEKRKRKSLNKNIDS